MIFINRKVSDAAAAAGKKALDILYPRRCPLCSEILRDPASLICRDCGMRLKPISGPVCMKCGVPVPAEEEYCPQCSRHPHLFRQGRGIFVYNEEWKNSLERYKYYGSREYADFYAAAMVRWGGSDIRRWKSDVITGVPLHIRKERTRGFSQAWYIAERIAGRTGIPASKDLLRKIRRTDSQKKLDYVHRRLNLAGAFEASAEARGRRVLVIDDVYTTGSTMDACAGALLKAGAADVCFLTFCIAVR